MEISIASSQSLVTRAVEWKINRYNLHEVMILQQICLSVTGTRLCGAIVLVLLKLELLKGALSQGCVTLRDSILSDSILSDSMHTLFNRTFMFAKHILTIFFHPNLS